MSHLLAHQGVLPGDQQEYIGNIAVGHKMSPLTPFPIGTSDMFSTIHTQQFGSNPVAMTADMYCAAPKSTGYYATTAGSNMVDIEMACSPRATDMPPHLGGFSVADIYFQPTSPFGNCPSVLDAAVGAPTPLFMNDGTYNVKSGSTAMDISTSMPNPPFNSTPGFQHKPFM
ncbi:hypothetical protein GGI03_004652 [Coemansia sp. RSA 2337]|nr:hypothetical protein H4S03_009543 [Coemansia sp. S3946]KAJ2462165.1 hypothetical protein GGI03_004652 [Coemansia sp. RSA 2337]